METETGPATETAPLYLSRIALNPRHRQVQWELANCQALHQGVMRFFPATEAAARAALRVLYRPELDARTGTVRLLIQSAAAPDWSRLPTDGGGQPYLVPASAIESRGIGAAYAALAAGQRLRFRLRANPTRRLEARPDDRLAGKRVALLKEAERREWLARKGEAAGVEIESVEIRTDAAGGSQTGRRVDVAADATRRLTFGAVVFDGVLRVTDPERLRGALRDGIGSGKAYGFGLLSVAPAPSPAGR